MLKQRLSDLMQKYLGACFAGVWQAKGQCYKLKTKRDERM